MEHFWVRRDSLHREGKEQETEPVGKQRSGLPTDPHLCKSPVPLLTPRTLPPSKFTKRRYIYIFWSTSGPLHDINNFHLKPLSSLNIWEAVLMSYFCLALFPWGETHQNSVRVQWDSLFPCSTCNQLCVLMMNILISKGHVFFVFCCFFTSGAAFEGRTLQLSPNPLGFYLPPFLCVCSRWPPPPPPPYVCPC